MTKTKTKTKKATSNLRPVLVTTVHRGVFFGYTDKIDGETITLTNARNCIYWSSAVRGFLGLAANGPDSQCRIGPGANLTLRAITAVAEVTPAAVPGLGSGALEGLAMALLRGATPSQIGSGSGSGSGDGYGDVIKGSPLIMASSPNATVPEPDNVARCPMCSALVETEGAAPSQIGSGSGSGYGYGYGYGDGYGSGSGSGDGYGDVIKGSP